MRNTLLELYKEFLPTIYKEDEMSAVSFSMSASSFTYMENNKETGEQKEVTNTNWATHFNIRAMNTLITLHNIPQDDELKHTEEKLLLLREGIEEFVKEVKARMVKPAQFRAYRREWLNPEELGADYTGYFFYNIQMDGNARFFIADCHRTLNFWFDVCPKGQGFGDQDNKATKRLLSLMMAIVKAINTWINHAKRLRKRYHKGELEKTAPKKANGLKITHF